MDMEDRRCDDGACHCNGGEDKDHCVSCRKCVLIEELRPRRGICMECALSHPESMPGKGLFIAYAFAGLDDF